MLGIAKQFCMVNPIRVLVEYRFLAIAPLGSLISNQFILEKVMMGAVNIYITEGEKPEEFYASFNDYEVEEVKNEIYRKYIGKSIKIRVVPSWKDHG
jgi:hypothetical protein